MNQTLTRSKGRPRVPVLDALYFEVKNYLHQERGHEKKKLKSNQHLALQFGISSASMNKLMKRFANEGLTLCLPGDGTYLLPLINDPYEDESEEVSTISIEVLNLEYPEHHRKFWKEQYRTFQDRHPQLNIGAGETGLRLTDLENASKLPDAFTLPSDHLYFFAKKGLLEPLDKYLSIDKTRELRAMNVSRYRGRTYGIPQDTNVNVLYINMDMLSKIITNADGFIPTPENIIALAQQFTKTFDTSHGFLTCPSHLTLVREFGPCTQNVVPDIDQDQAGRLERLFHFFAQISNIPAGFVFPSQNRFMSGKTLFHIGGTFYAKTYRDSPHHIKAHSLEHFNQSPPVQDALVWCLPKGGRNNIHAWQWIQQVIGRDFQIQRAQQGARFPALMNSDVEKQYREVCLDGMDDIYSSLEAKATPSLNYRYLPSYWNEVWRPILNQVLQQELDPKSAVKKIIDATSRIKERSDILHAQNIRDNLSI